jgi:hypothetical protein
MLDSLGNIESHIEFAPLAVEVAEVALRLVSAQGWLPPYPHALQVLLRTGERDQPAGPHHSMDLREPDWLYGRQGCLGEVA